MNSVRMFRKCERLYHMLDSIMESSTPSSSVQVGYNKLLSHPQIVVALLSMTTIPMLLFCNGIVNNNNLFHPSPRCIRYNSYQIQIELSFCPRGYNSSKPHSGSKSHVLIVFVSHFPICVDFIFLCAGLLVLLAAIIAAPDNPCTRLPPLPLNTR